MTDEDFRPYQLPPPVKVQRLNRAAKRRRRNLPALLGGTRPQHYPDQLHDRLTLCGVKRKDVEYTGVMERVTCSRCSTKLSLRGYFGRAGAV